MNLIIKLLLIALLIGFRPAVAQEVEVGTGVVCDTSEQVSAFVKHMNEGKTSEVAVDAINSEAANACGILPVAYIRGDKVGTVRTKSGKADIVSIIIVGVFDGTRWIRAQPIPQFTLFLTKDEEA